MFRVAFATWRSQPGLTADDRLAVRPLARLGIEVEAAVWSAGSVSWKAYDAVVLRSTWDYHVRTHDFQRWLNHLEAGGVRVFNAPDLVRWNLDKRYLAALAAGGVPTEPTVWLSWGVSADLTGLLAAEGWAEAVVKPSVSASAHRTWGTSRQTAAVDQPQLDRMLSRGDVMVQRLNPHVRSEGEWSLVFFGGEYSHAVVKRPAAGDFRVQERMGGALAPAQPSTGLVDGARAALAAVRFAAPPAADHPLYARVDGVSEEDRIVVMEVELIEPSLFLATAPGAADRFAAALAAALDDDDRAARNPRPLRAPA